MNPATRRWAVPALCATLAAATVVSCSAGRPLAPPGPGARVLPGAGDPYYPDLGNAGYHTGHYSLDLRVDPARGSLAGTATIRARATRRLPKLSLDLAGLTVLRVSIGGQPATASRAADKLVITPPHPVAAGQPFTVTVAYQGIPRPIPDASGDRTGAAQVGWHHAGHEIYVASEPAGARTWYPVNDTPGDKASYDFQITVPAGYTAVANGVPTTEHTTAGVTTFGWRENAPMASYLATLEVGRFTRIAGTGPGGLPILSYAPPALAVRARRTFANLPAMIRYFEHILGPYPFASAGVTVVSPAFRWSLETQTRPVYGSQILTLGRPTAREGISHELAHQWFGDSLTPARWRDIWLNEGFATYLSWLWLEHHGDRAYLSGLMRTQYGYELNASDYAALLQHPDMPPAQVMAIVQRQFRPGGRPQATGQILAAMGLTSLRELTAQRALGLLGVKPGSADAAGYLEAARSSAPATPPRTDLFTTAVYSRGAMTLQALRIRVGDRTFFRILHGYAATHRYGNVSTADFIADASKISGQNLHGFFTRWLYAPAPPPMPRLLPTQ